MPYYGRLNIDYTDYDYKFVSRLSIYFLIFPRLNFTEMSVSKPQFFCIFNRLTRVSVTLYEMRNMFFLDNPSIS